MKRTLVACLLSLVPCSLLLLYAIAVHERGELELSITRLEERQRRLEEEVRELKAAEAQVLPAIRRLEARGTALTERLQELQGRMASAESSPGSRLASSAELDEVVSAVNQLVDVVDELSSRAERQWTEGVLDGEALTPPVANTFRWLRSLDSDGSTDLNVVIKQRTLQSAAFSPDGKLILTGDSGGKIARVWDAASGALVGKLEEPEMATEPNGSPPSMGDEREAAPEVILFPDSSSWSTPPTTPGGPEATPADEGPTGSGDPGLPHRRPDR